jgi:hypothetical protein
MMVNEKHKEWDIHKERKKDTYIQQEVINQIRSIRDEVIKYPVDRIDSKNSILPHIGVSVFQVTSDGG